ncbi:MAG: hypothetical protein QOF86_4430, partial [Baekduia sp.]|nr:hypothetical protein [Baekduia sp.]
EDAHGQPPEGGIVVHDKYGNVHHDDLPTAAQAWG